MAEHGLQRVQQLLHVPLIQSNVSIVQWSDWFQAFSQLRAPERFAVRFDRAQMSLDAATQGLGVALESAMNAGGHIADGRLVAPSAWTGPCASRPTCRLPARNARRPAVAAFLAWLHAEAARTEQQPCRQCPD